MFCFFAALSRGSTKWTRRRLLAIRYTDHSEFCFCDRLFYISHILGHDPRWNSSPVFSNIWTSYLPQGFYFVTTQLCLNAAQLYIILQYIVTLGSSPYPTQCSPAQLLCIFHANGQQLLPSLWESGWRQHSQSPVFIGDMGEFLQLINENGNIKSPSGSQNAPRDGQLF